MKRPTCRDCGGSGLAECPECGAEDKCNWCDGTGLDPDKIDTAAWAEASENFTRVNGTSYGLVVDGEYLGQTVPSGDRLLLSNYRKQP